MRRAFKLAALWVCALLLWGGAFGAPPKALWAGESIVAGMSQNYVSINADFDGLEILIYGAVKRDGPAPEGAAPAHVVITLEGPSEAVRVHKKDRRLGVWVNTEGVQFTKVPSFYAIATTGPLSEILSETQDLRHQISIGRAIRVTGLAVQTAQAPAFVDALIRVRKEQGIYRLEEESVNLIDGTLFRADIVLPDQLVEGRYRLRIFLTREKEVISMASHELDVRKEGLERSLTHLAHERPLIYGIISLLIAVGAAYAASTLFRLWRA